MTTNIHANLSQAIDTALSRARNHNSSGLHDLLTISRVGEEEVFAHHPTVALIGRILVVDDNIALAANVAEVLELSGYRATTAESGDHALALFDREVQDVGALITDFRMPNQNGAELIAEIRRRGSQVPALVMSAFADEETVQACTEAGALAVLPKPIVIDQLIALVAML